MMRQLSIASKMKADIDAKIASDDGVDVIVQKISSSVNTFYGRTNTFEDKTIRLFILNKGETERILLSGGRIDGNIVAYGSSSGDNVPLEIDENLTWESKEWTTKFVKPLTYQGTIIGYRYELVRQSSKN